MGYYREYEIPVNEVPARCAEASAERKNLLLGKPIFGISSDAPIGETYGTDNFNTKDNSMQLTDGVIASQNVYTDTAFFRLTRGSGRSIVFKLDGECAVSGFSMGFLRQDDVAVRLPRRVDVLLSQNGRDWQRVVKARKLGSASSPDRVVVSAEFEHPYKACWLQVEIEVPCHVYLDEIELFGTTAIPDDALDIKGEELGGENSARQVGKYPEYSDFLDVHNLLLAYNCIPAEEMGNTKRGFTTVEQFIPHIAYIDGEGKMKDTFFDSFLFLPYSAYTYSKLYKCAGGWRYYLDNLFAKDGNVDALEQAAQIVCDTMKLNNLNLKVFFSILHTQVHYGEFPKKFGDLDGDGRDEDFTTFEDRAKAVKWIIDQQLERFAAMNAKHLTLGGFYWFEEEINYNDAFETELIAYARDYLHSLGYKLFWIPYFQAWGYQDWKENGFDIACMQPNYAFRKEEPIQRLYDNALMTKNLGLCVEMEIGGLKEVDINRYRDYLDVGAETGYMKTIKMYYQGGIPGEFYHSYKSSDPFVRSVYDDTYLFAKEKYIPRKK